MVHERLDRVVVQSVHVCEFFCSLTQDSVAHDNPETVRSKLYAVLSAAPTTSLLAAQHQNGGVGPDAVELVRVQVMAFHTQLLVALIDRLRTTEDATWSETLVANEVVLCQVNQPRIENGELELHLHFDMKLSSLSLVAKSKERSDLGNMDLRAEKDGAMAMRVLLFLTTVLRIANR